MRCDAADTQRNKPEGARVLDGMTTHVLYEGPAGVIAKSEELVIEGSSLDALASAAARAAERADRIELCGGVGVEDAATVIAAVGDAADVRVNRYGFESLEQVAAYKAAFATGGAGGAAFLYAAPSSTSLATHEGVLAAGVADDAALVERAREAQARGVGIIELYGGLGAQGAAAVRAATDHAIAVGFVD